MTIIDFLNEKVRIPLSDSLKTRWEDSDLLSFAKVAIKRVNSVGKNNDMPFMQTKANITLADGVDFFPLPSGFMAPLSLVDNSTKRKMEHIECQQFDTVISAAPMSVYCIDGDEVRVAGRQSGEATAIFRYYTEVDTSLLLLSSQMPWGDRFNDIVADYVIFRAKNADEYNTSTDVAALNELEQAIYSAYGNINPVSIKSSGWL